MFYLTIVNKNFRHCHFGWHDSSRVIVQRVINLISLFFIRLLRCLFKMIMRGSIRGGGQGVQTPLENHLNIDFLAILVRIP